VRTGPRRQNSTEDRAELLAIVRATRPWAGPELRNQLRARSAGHWWEAATLVELEDVAGSFRALLRDEISGEIDQEIDDETACGAIGVMLANVMKGRHPRNTDLLADIVTINPNGRTADSSGFFKEATRRRWREEGLSWREDRPADGGLHRFLSRVARRDGLAYLMGTLGYEEPNARAWLRRHPDENPATARPFSRDHAEGDAPGAVKLEELRDSERTGNE
jgi:hypothetical protein